MQAPVPVLHLETGVFSGNLSGFFFNLLTMPRRIHSSSSTTNTHNMEIPPIFQIYMRFYASVHGEKGRQILTHVPSLAREIMVSPYPAPQQFISRWCTFINPMDSFVWITGAEPASDSFRFSASTWLGSMPIPLSAT